MQALYCMCTCLFACVHVWGFLTFQRLRYVVFAYPLSTEDHFSGANLKFVSLLQLKDEIKLNIDRILPFHKFGPF